VGVDQATTGLKEIVTGQHQKSMAHQVVENSFTAHGVPQVEAERRAAAAETLGLGLLGTVAAASEAAPAAAAESPSLNAGRKTWTDFLPEAQQRLNAAKAQYGESGVVAMADEGATVKPAAGAEIEGGAPRSPLGADVTASYPDPDPRVYRNGLRPDSVVIDHRDARALGGHPTHTDNLNPRAWSENASKGWHEGNYLFLKREYMKKGLTEAQAEWVLEDYRRFIRTDIFATPVDPAKLDRLPSP
jgi:hypothetical protein